MPAGGAYSTQGSVRGRKPYAALGVEEKVMQIVIDEVLRYWYSLRLRILIALDTTETVDDGDADPDVPDTPDI